MSDLNTERETALSAYLREHDTCDVQRHPWQYVFRAAFQAGYEASRAAREAAEAREARLREAVALLNSMVLSGEDHSDTSRAVVRAALDG